MLCRLSVLWIVLRRIDTRAWSGTALWDTNRRFVSVLHDADRVDMSEPDGTSGASRAGAVPLPFLDIKLEHGSTRAGPARCGARALEH